PQITQHLIQGGAANVTIGSFDAFTVQQPPQAEILYHWSIVTNNLNCSNGGTLPTIIGASGSTYITGSYITVNHGTCTGTYRLRCKAVNICGVSNYQDKEMNVYNPDISNPCDSKMGLYPNPVKGGSVVLKMQYPDEPCDNNKMASTPYAVAVYDMYGALLLQTKSASETLSLNLRKFKPGMYFVNLRDALGHEEKSSLIIK